MSKKLAYFVVALVMEADLEAGVIACWDCHHWVFGSVEGLRRHFLASLDPVGASSEITSMILARIDFRMFVCLRHASVATYERWGVYRLNVRWKRNWV